MATITKKAVTSTRKENPGTGKNVLQPVLNLGIVGHVDHGKTTITQALSGKWTDTHSEEIRKGITIRLGYANFSVYKCGSCPEPDCYSISEKCGSCSKKCSLVRKISIVDAPGHESLMATMLSGAAIIDGAILLVAANESCPQPQTREHLVALQIIGIKQLVVVQNKIDLISEKGATQNYAKIKEFLKGTPYANAPVIPVSAQHGINLDALLQVVEETIPTPERDPEADPIMLVARSFDVNRPGIGYADLTGGVLGGTLKQGSLAVNDEIEIKPGRLIDRHGKISREPVRTKITGLNAGNVAVKEAFPGGTIGVMTSLDPSIVKSDNFAGNILGKPGKIPEVWDQLNLKIDILERVVGAKDDLVVGPLKINENFMLNVNSSATVGIVTALKKNVMTCTLRIPVCADKGSRVTISRLLGSRWRLIGYGIIV